MPDQAAVTRLHHYGIDVDDLEAQSAFYRAAFNLDVDIDQDLPEYRFRYVMLRSSDGWSVELFKRDGAAARGKPDDPDGQHDVLGIGHACFQVGDVSQMHSHLLALGAVSRIPPSPSPVPEIPFAYLTDPEGNLIELLGPE